MKVKRILGKVCSLVQAATATIETSVDFGLQGLKKDKVELPTKPADDVENVRHQAMMDAIAPYAKKVQQSNATPVYINYKTRNTKLVLVMCPEWAPDMPPFNLARLSGIAKSAGYETHILDLNIRAYNEFEKVWWPEKRLPFRLWNPSATWHWLGETYWKDIHPLLGPLCPLFFNIRILWQTSMPFFTVLMKKKRVNLLC